jgi:hypothetical protein
MAIKKARISPGFLRFMVHFNDNYGAVHWILFASNVEMSEIEFFWSARVEWSRWRSQWI